MLTIFDENLVWTHDVELHSLIVRSVLFIKQKKDGNKQLLFVVNFCYTVFNKEFSTFENYQFFLFFDYLLVLSNWLIFEIKWK